MRKLSHLIWALPLALASSARAADPAPPPMWPVGQFKPLLQTISPEAARIVRELTADDFKTREHASQELAAKGLDAFSGLQLAVAESKDPELLARTNTLLGNRVFEIPANFPSRAVDFIHHYEDARATRIATTRRGTPTGAAPPLLLGGSPSTSERDYLALQFLQAQETVPALRDLLIAQRGADVVTAPLRAKMAIASGNLDEAQSILSAPQSVANRVALMAMRQGEAFDPQRELDAPHALTLNPRDRNLLGYYLFRAKGDFDRAAEFGFNAQVSGRFWLDARRYTDMVERADAAAAAAKPSHGIGEFEYALAYTLTGNPKRADEILQYAIAHPDEFRTSFPGTWLGTFQGLLKNDRAADAIQLAKTRPDTQSVGCRILCAQLRIRDGLAALADRKHAGIEVPRLLIDLDLNPAARNLLKDMEPDTAAPTASAFLSEFAGQFERVGETDLAARWRNSALGRIDSHQQETKDLNQAIARLSQQIKATELDPAQFRQRQQLNTQQSQLLSQRNALAAGSVKKYDFARDPRFPTRELAIEAEFWFERLGRSGALDSRGRYEKTVLILSGQLTGEELLKEAPVRQLGNMSIGPLRQVAERLHAMHRDDLALDLVNEWCKFENDPSGFIILGDFAMDEKQPAKAADWYQKAAIINLTDASLMYRLGYALSQRPDTAPTGRQLIAYAPYLVLGESFNSNGIIEAMTRLEGRAAAENWLDARVNRLFPAASSLSYGSHFLRQAVAAESRGDFAEALALHTQLLFTPPEPAANEDIGFMLVGFMQNVAAWHRARALDALQRKVLPTLADALDRHLNNAPPDVELLEKTLPTLKAANPEAAQKILTRAIDRLKPIVDDYPEATQYKDQVTRLQTLTK